MANKYMKPDAIPSVTQDDPTGRKWTWEKDGYTVIRTNARTAPGCHDNCGVLVYVKDGKVDHVEGDPENPYNQGRLCVRCLAATEILYNPDRVIYPMKRAREDRGKNTWERCSWDEAYAIIKDRFSYVIENYGAQAICVHQGTGRDINGYTPITARWFGTPNSGTGFLSGLACYAPRMFSTALKIGGFFIADYGHFFADGINNPQYKVPGCILVWGNNPLVANSDGTLGYWILECMKRGSKLLCVDPKLTWLAGKADVWLDIRPGTDTAMFLGICNYLIEHDLYDHEFVDLWCYGFDAFKDAVKDYTLERVSEITWVDAELIEQAARLIVDSGTATLQWGVAMDHTPEGFITGMAAFDLMALTGNFEKPGTMIYARQCFDVGETWMPGDEFFEDVPPTPFAADPSLKINQKYPAVHAMAAISPDMELEAMETGEPYRPRAFWLQTNNPMICMGPAPQRTKPALESLDTVINVVVDLFMTPTAMACADIFLPACTWMERDGLIGHQPYQMGAIQKCMEPLGESKSDIQIIREVGQLMVGKEICPWETDEDFYNYILRKTTLDWEQLRDRVWAFPEYEYYKHEKGLLRKDGKPGFNTQYGRFNFYVPAMVSFGFNPLAEYEEPPESPVSNPELFAEYPFVLTTGARRWGLFHSEHRQSPSMRMLHPCPQVMINPADAAPLGIRQGDKVRIENNFGDCVMWADVSMRIKKGVVSADHAWWYPERDPNDGTCFGLMESNINRLIPMRPGKTGLGSSYKTQLCKITKVEE